MAQDGRRALMAEMPIVAAVARRCDPIELSGHFNNVAITAASSTGGGAFNVWGNSFAAEHLPAGESLVVVGDVPFRFPPVGKGPDNIRCNEQYVSLPAGRCDWLHVLAAAERRCEDVVEMTYEDGAVDAEPLRVSDFWAAPAWFGEIKAFECPVMHYPHHVQPGVSAIMWAQRVPVTRRGVLVGVRLPRNIAIHVFALTAERPEGSA